MKTNTMDRPVATAASAAASSITTAAGGLATGLATGLAAGLERFGVELGRFFAAMAAGAQASRDYDRLSRSSDRELEREGLTRDGIVREVMERHFR